MVPEFLLRSEAPIARDQVMLGMMSCLGDILGRPVRIGTVDFVDSTPADFFGCDANGEIHAVRWIEPGPVEEAVGRLLADYHRLRTAGAAAISERLSIPGGPADGAIHMILVGPELGAAWVEAAAGLAFSTRLIEVHRLGRHGGARDTYYFRSLTGAPGADAPAPAMDAYAGLSAEEAASFEALASVLPDPGE